MPAKFSRMMHIRKLELNVEMLSIWNELIFSFFSDKFTSVYIRGFHSTTGMVIVCFNCSTSITNFLIFLLGTTILLTQVTSKNPWVLQHYKGAHIITNVNLVMMWWIVYAGLRMQAADKNWSIWNLKMLCDTFARYGYSLARPCIW
jgi:hypothetical protein